MMFTKFWEFFVSCTVASKITCVTSNDNQLPVAYSRPEKNFQLIFDITNQTADIVENFCNSTMKFKLENQWKLSIPLYLWMSEEGQRTSETVEPQNLLVKVYAEFVKQYLLNATDHLKGDRNYTRDIAFFTNTEQLCDKKSLSTLAKAVDSTQTALRFASSSYECRRLCVPLSLNYTIFALQNFSFGIDIDQRLFECLSQSCQFVFSDVKFIVLNTQLESVTNTLSYGGFTRKMDSILLNEYEVWKRQNPTGWFYIRILIKKTLAIERNKEDHMKTFIEQFASAWVQNRSNLSIILETYVMPADNKLKTRHTEVAIPHINFNPDLDYANLIQNPASAGWNDFPSTCELWQAIRTANPIFKKYLIQVPNWNTILRLIQESKTFPAVKYLSNDTSILVIGNESQTLLQNFSSKISNPKLISLLKFFQANVNDMPGTYLKVLNTGICITAEQNDSSDLCPQQKRKTIYNTRAIKQRKVNVPYSTTFDPLDFHLSQILNSEYVEGNYAGGFDNRTLWIDFRIVDLTVTHHIRDDLKRFFRRNLYCSEVLQKIKEMQETIINWAKIHDIYATPFSLIDTDSRTGWWYMIATVPDINLTVTNNFSVLVRRNVPPSLDVDFTSGPFTYPCISVSSNNVRDIKVKNSSYVGISVNLDSLSSFAVLNENHIRALIVIALSRFSVVHIKAKLNTAKKLINALNENFEEKLPKKIGKHSKDTNLFLEHDATDLLNSNGLRNVQFPLAGLHVSGCYSHAECPITNLASILQNMELKYGIGIVIINCIAEINLGPDQLRNHPLFDISSYIVCENEITGLISDYFQRQDWIQMHLDTTFYVQNYFSFHYNKTTYWKYIFDNLCTDKDSILGYLRLMDVFSQYADGYKINYFLSDAFVNCSWWHIDNYNDLLNASAYLERATGERLTGTLIDDLVPASPSLSLVISLSVLSLLLLAGICGLYAYHRLKTKKLLNKQEVNAFVSGEEIEVNTELISLGQIQVQTTRSLGFNKAFEISKRNITLGGLIGSGNFGQVFEGMVNDGQKVAIKQSKPDCSKEVFKTMLAETKVLSYLGEHENVVKFIGAYTKEIDVGIIYIVTEFCENGNLENYLQAKFKLQESAMCITSDNPRYASAPDIIREQPDLKEFCRFAMEIASGMNYIAERKIVHADLSTRNVLMDGNNVCKIADFGLSRKLYESGIYKKEGKEELPWRWMAIESLKDREFTTRSDVWSYGITLWEIFSLGDIPYPGVVMWDDKFASRLERGFRMSTPGFASDEIYETMLSCWNLDPIERPTFLELFEFFKNIETLFT